MRYLYALDILSSVNIRDYPLIAEILFGYSCELNTISQGKGMTAWESLYKRDGDRFNVDISTMTSTYIIMCTYIVLKSQSKIPITIHHISALDADMETIYLKQGDNIISCLTDQERNEIEIQWIDIPLLTGKDITASDLIFMYQGNRDDVVECTPYLEIDGDDWDLSQRIRYGYIRYVLSGIFQSVLDASIKPTRQCREAHKFFDIGIICM